MELQRYTIRNARQNEFDAVGQLMVGVYSQLDGFPKPSEQPAYYQMLATIGNLTNRPATELLVAVDFDNTILGCVVYFSDMQFYGPGGIASSQPNAAGFRLLAVAPHFRNKGIGRALTQACIEKSRQKNLEQVIIHSSKSMQTAWNLYERLGFERSEDLDFQQGKLPVFGFRLLLQ